MLLFNPPINLSILPAYLPGCRPACRFDLSILSAYSTCLFNPPVQPTSYNKYSRRYYFSTYQSSIYPTFLSNLPIQSAYPICLSICLLNLPTQSAYSICLLNLPTQSACPICLSNLPVQSTY